MEDGEDGIHSEVYGERQGDATHHGDCRRTGAIQNRDAGAGWCAAQKAQSHSYDLGPFIDFMLDKILRTLKAKGRTYEASLKSDQKKRVRSDQKTTQKSDQKRTGRSDQKSGLSKRCRGMGVAH